MKKKIMLEDDEHVTKGFLAKKFAKVDEKARKYRDEIMNGQDKIMAELEAMREENTIGAYQTRELREEIDDHEKRIKVLEKQKN